MKANARECALQVLIACRKNDAWADAALKAALKTDTLSAPDAALCSRIVYGVMQNKLLLDHYIGAYCSQSPEHLQPPLLDILRIGAYQILFLDKIPDSAAVNEAVTLTKNTKRAQAAGLVNAVLRKISQNKEHLPPLSGDDATQLSVRFSHPKWLVERLLSLLGREHTEAFLRLNNEAAPMTAQVNPLITSTESLVQELTDAGIRVREHDWVPDCLELSGTGDLTTLPAFYKGKFTVQDAAAKLVACIANCKRGDRVLDVCAAPGGKSFGAAFLMENEGTILSCDLHENKLKRIREGAQRLGISCIETAAADGRVFHEEWNEAFDVVLCDVPCSGLGIIRKKPDVRYKDAEALAKLPEIQAEILANSARYVRRGGVLVYSTCTILPEENERLTDAFLSSHPDFTYESFTLPAPVGEVPGHITMWPQIHATDGFYICRMRRRDHD